MYEAPSLCTIYSNIHYYMLFPSFKIPWRLFYWLESENMEWAHGAGVVGVFVYSCLSGLSALTGKPSFPSVFFFITFGKMFRRFQGFWADTWENRRGGTWLWVAAGGGFRTPLNAGVWALTQFCMHCIRRTEKTWADVGSPLFPFFAFQKTVFWAVEDLWWCPLSLHILNPEGCYVCFRGFVVVFEGLMYSRLTPTLLCSLVFLSPTSPVWGSQARATSPNKAQFDLCVHLFSEIFAWNFPLTH